MTASDFFSDLLENFKERIRNPLLIAFAISWSVWNWEIWILLFRFDGSAQELIFCLQDLPYTFGQLSLWPLLSAIAYVALAPFIAWLFQWIAMKPKKGLSNLSHDREYNSLINKVKREKKKVELENVKADHKEISDLNARIRQLNEQVESHKTLAENLQSEIHSYEEKFSDMSNQWQKSEKESKILVEKIDDLENLNDQKIMAIIEVGNIIEDLKTQVNDNVEALQNQSSLGTINTNQIHQNYKSLLAKIFQIKEVTSYILSKDGNYSNMEKTEKRIINDLKNSKK